MVSTVFFYQWFISEIPEYCDVGLLIMFISVVNLKDSVWFASIIQTFVFFLQINGLAADATLPIETNWQVKV